MAPPTPTSTPTRKEQAILGREIPGDEDTPEAKRPETIECPFCGSRNNCLEATDVDLTLCFEEI
ncbi:hypothetical protein TWF106_006261 [Orbilia oligospora]|uniref:Uncharacterized protein n=1 Tax=Orbilia oligospora TaxID=2813651 RepID=A0A7C8V2U0_ORBOL|nr:hypothetical protein TWF106_006261 [Orbilia oligospora]